MAELEHPQGALGGDGSGESAQNGAGAGCVKKTNGAQIAKAWGCSPAYVSRLKSEGMPVDSLEAANAWRANRSAGRGIGFRSKSQPGQNGADSLAGSVPFSESGGTQERVKLRSLKNIEASLKGAIEIEEEAHRQVVAAQRAQEDGRLPNLIAAYTKAREGRYDSEERVLAILKEAGILIPSDESKSALSRVLGTLFSRLRAAPAQAAPIANPTDDLHAEEVIRKSIEQAITETHAIVATAFGLSADEISAAALPAAA